MEEHFNILARYICTLSVDAATLGKVARGVWLPHADSAEPRTSSSQLNDLGGTPPVYSTVPSCEQASRRR